MEHPVGTRQEFEYQGGDAQSEQQGECVPTFLGADGRAVLGLGGFDHTHVLHADGQLHVHFFTHIELIHVQVVQYALLTLQVHVACGAFGSHLHELAQAFVFVLDRSYLGLKRGHQIVH